MKNIQIEEIKENARKAQKEIKRKTIVVPAYNTETKKIGKREYVLRSGKEGNSLKRLALIIIFILIELAFLSVIYVRFIIGFLWFLFIPYGIGIIFAFRVAVMNKNSDSKISWIMFLLVFAPIAVFVYLLAGEMSATPLNARKFKRINASTQLLPKTSLPDGLTDRLRQECEFIQNTSDYIPFFTGEAQYFSMGEDFFEDVLTRLRSAERFIFMDFFILEEGHLMDAVLEILTEKAKAGVDVRLIADGLGSHDMLSYKKIRKIKKQGIRIIAFAPVFPLINFFVNYRDHRKIIVIDGQTGYVGGTNIADEYINAKERFYLWKDASLRIDGEAVKSLTLMFLRMWEYSTGEKPDYDLYLKHSSEHMNAQTVGGTLIAPYACGPNEKHRLGRSVYLNMIASARKSLYIMTPYFIVDSSLTELLKAKAQSGIDVRLIIPGIPDKKLIYSLTLSNAERLTAGGVRVYTYTPGFLHSKVMLSDDECAVVGSINFDFRSFYQQYESAAYISASQTLKEIAADFQNTFDASKEIKFEDIKKRNIFNRIWLAFIRLFAPLM